MPAGPASAAVIQFSSTMDAAQAFSTCPGGSPATGRAVSLTYDTSTNMLTWDITFENLSGPVTVAHFHGPALPGADAGIQVSITDLMSPSMGSAMLTDTQEGQLLSKQWYINYHTAMCPGGEIRGQVFQSPVGGIAEPPEVARAPLDAAGSSGPDAGLLAGVVSAAVAGSVALGGVVWYARRRRAAE